MAAASSFGVEGGVSAVHPWHTASSHLPASPHHHPHPPHHHPHLATLTLAHQGQDADRYLYTDGSSSGYTTPSEQEQEDGSFSSASAREATGVASESDAENMQLRSVDDTNENGELRTRSADGATTYEEHRANTCEFQQDGRQSVKGHHHARTSHSRLSHSAGSVRHCDFLSMKSCEALVRLSEDVRNVRLLYHLHTKCSSAVTKPFGPWCQKLTAKKAKQLYYNTTNASSNLRGGKESTSPSKDRPSEKIVLANLMKYAGTKDKPTKNGNVKELPNTPKDKNTKSSDAEKNTRYGDVSWRQDQEKTTKSSDVFERLGGGSTFKFRHRDDVRSYMAEYRERHTVGMIGRKSRRVPVLGVDLPDPYVAKKKKPCVSLENLPLNATPTGTTILRRTPVQDNSDVSKDCVSRDKPARPVPNLAPVREKLNTTSDISSQEKRANKPRTNVQSTPTLLVLPSIRKGEDPRSLSLVGYSHSNHVTPTSSESGPIECSAVSWTNGVYYAGIDSQKNEHFADGDRKRDKGKAGVVRLKYTNRTSLHDVPEMAQEDEAACETPKHQTDSSGISEFHRCAETTDNQSRKSSLSSYRTNAQPKKSTHVSKTDHSGMKRGLHSQPEKNHHSKKRHRRRSEIVSRSLDSTPDNRNFVSFSMPQALTSPKLANPGVEGEENFATSKADFDTVRDRINMTASVDGGLDKLTRHHQRHNDKDGRVVSVRVMSVENLPSAFRTQPARLSAENAWKIHERSLLKKGLHDVDLNSLPELDFAFDAKQFPLTSDKPRTENALALWNTDVAATKITNPEGAKNTDFKSTFLTSVYLPLSGIPDRTNDARDKMAQIRTGTTIKKSQNRPNITEVSISSQNSQASETTDCSLGVRGKTFTELSLGNSAASKSDASNPQTGENASGSRNESSHSENRGEAASPRPLQKESVRLAVTRNSNESPSQQHSKNAFTCCTRKAAAMHFNRHHSRSRGETSSPGDLIVHGGAFDTCHLTGRDDTAHADTNGDAGTDGAVPEKVTYRLSMVQNGND